MTQGPEPLTDAEIEQISLDTWLKNARPFATNIEAYTAISRAIEAARDKQWREWLGMQEPIAYLAWRDDKPCYEGDDAVCEDAVWPVDSDDDRQSMPVYLNPAAPAPEPRE